MSQWLLNEDCLKIITIDTNCPTEPIFNPTLLSPPSAEIEIVTGSSLFIEDVEEVVCSTIEEVVDVKENDIEVEGSIKEAIEVSIPVNGNVPESAEVQSFVEGFEYWPSEVLTNGKGSLLEDSVNFKNSQHIVSVSPEHLQPITNKQICDVSLEDGSLSSVLHTKDSFSEPLKYSNVEVCLSTPTTSEEDGKYTTVNEIEYIVKVSNSTSVLSDTELATKTESTCVLNGNSAGKELFSTKQNKSPQLISEQKLEDVAEQPHNDTKSYTNKKHRLISSLADKLSNKLTSPKNRNSADAFRFLRQTSSGRIVKRTRLASEHVGKEKSEMASSDLLPECQNSTLSNASTNGTMDVESDTKPVVSNPKSEKICFAGKVNSGSVTAATRKKSHNTEVKERPSRTLNSSDILKLVEPKAEVKRESDTPAPAPKRRRTSLDKITVTNGKATRSAKADVTSVKLEETNTTNSSTSNAKKVRQKRSVVKEEKQINQTQNEITSKPKSRKIIRKTPKKKEPAKKEENKCGSRLLKEVQTLIEEGFKANKKIGTPFTRIRKYKSRVLPHRKRTECEKLLEMMSEIQGPSVMNHLERRRAVNVRKISSSGRIISSKDSQTPASAKLLKGVGVKTPPVKGLLKGSNETSPASVKGAFKPEVAETPNLKTKKIDSETSSSVKTKKAERETVNAAKGKKTNGNAAPQTRSKKNDVDSKTKKTDVKVLTKKSKSKKKLATLGDGSKSKKSVAKSKESKKKKAPSTASKKKTLRASKADKIGKSLKLSTKKVPASCMTQKKKAIKMKLQLEKKKVMKNVSPANKINAKKVKKSESSEKPVLLQELQEKMKAKLDSPEKSTDEDGHADIGGSLWIASNLKSGVSFPLSFGLETSSVDPYDLVSFKRPPGRPRIRHFPSIPKPAKVSRHGKTLGRPKRTENEEPSSSASSSSSNTSCPQLTSAISSASAIPMSYSQQKNMLAPNLFLRVPMISLSPTIFVDESSVSGKVAKSDAKQADKRETSKKCVFRHMENSCKFKEIALKFQKQFVQIILISNTTIKNGLNPRVLKELKAAFISCRKDNNCRVVLLNSVGNIFCSGVDLTYLLKENKEQRQKAIAEMISALKDFLRLLISFPKPIVAAVNGIAVGLGMAILPLCDIVYASDKATFYAPYAKLGQSPEGCASFMFPATMNLSVAGDMLFGLRRLTAEEAHHHGLVANVFWPESLLEEVIPRVERMASQNAQAMGATKTLIRQRLRGDLEATLQRECQLLNTQWFSAECQNAMRKFVDTEEFI